MPLFLKGRGNYTRICEQCGKPFVKTARVQKKCEKCKLKSWIARGNIPKKKKD